MYLESLKNFYQPKTKFDQQIKQPELLMGPSWMISVKIPLVYCNLDNIRVLSFKPCLPTWNQPSQSCLATRVVTGTFITQNLIEKIEFAEELLMDFQIENAKLRI